MLFSSPRVSLLVAVSCFCDKNDQLYNCLFQGGRTSDEIVGWLKKKTGPPAKEFSSADDLKAFVDSKDVVVAGFFKDKESAEAKQFIEAASDIDDIEFAIAANDLKGYEQDKDASVVLYKKVCLIQLSQA